MSCSCTTWELGYERNVLHNMKIIYPRILNSCSSITELSVSQRVFWHGMSSLTLTRFPHLLRVTLANVYELQIVSMVGQGVPESLESFEVHSANLYWGSMADVDLCARQLCACPRLQTLRIDDEALAEEVLDSLARRLMHERRAALKRIRMRLPWHMQLDVARLRFFAHLQEVDIVVANESSHAALGGIDVVQTMTALSQLPRLTRMEVAASCSWLKRNPFACGTDKERGAGDAEGGPRLEVLRLNCLQIEEPQCENIFGTEVCKHRLLRPCFASIVCSVWSQQSLMCGNALRGPLWFCPPWPSGILTPCLCQNAATCVNKARVDTGCCSSTGRGADAWIDAGAEAVARHLGSTPARRPRPRHRPCCVFSCAAHDGPLRQQVHRRRGLCANPDRARVAPHQARPRRQ